MTGKPLGFGGSLIRPEATGYGLVYYTEEMLKANGNSFAGKKVVISGSGNVAQYALQKQLNSVQLLFLFLTQMVMSSMKMVSTSIFWLMLKKTSCSFDWVCSWKATATYHEGTVWTYAGNYDIALPCATQNEINGEAAKRLVAQGVICVSEGANMPSDLDAIKVYKENGIFYGPAKLPTLVV